MADLERSMSRQFLLARTLRLNVDPLVSDHTIRGLWYSDDLNKKRLLSSHTFLSISPLISFLTNFVPRTGFSESSAGMSETRLMPESVPPMKTWFAFFKAPHSINLTAQLIWSLSRCVKNSATYIPPLTALIRS